MPFCKTSFIVRENVAKQQGYTVKWFHHKRNHFQREEVEFYIILPILPTGLIGPVFYFSPTKYDNIVVTIFVMLAVNLTFWRGVKSWGKRKKKNSQVN